MGHFNRHLAATSLVSMMCLLSFEAQADSLSATRLEQEATAPIEARRSGSDLGPKNHVVQKLSSLNLTDNQHAAIIEMQKTWKVEQERQLKDKLKAARQDLALAMTENTQIQDIRKKFESVQKSYLELQNLTFEKSLKIREILSVDQRRKFQDLRLDVSE